jgi:hypothetical protein
MLLQREAERKRQKPPQAMQMTAHIPTTLRRVDNFCGGCLDEYWVRLRYLSDDGRFLSRSFVQGRHPR